MHGGEPDIIDGFEAVTLSLPPDALGAPEATLVSHPEDSPTAPAVLYVHGYNDYWFQEPLAAAWRTAGFAWHALDLRRHGRSLRPGQQPAYTEDMRDYFVELDLAVDRIRAADPGRPLVLMGHSTGGLCTSLFAHARPGVLDALVLNAPFLGFGGPWHERLVLTTVIPAVGAVEPRWVVQADGGPLYASSLHRSFGRGGDWEYDLSWKRAGGLPTLAGWVRAVHEGHEAVRGGLDVRCPVLCLTSARSGGGSTWNDSFTCSDVVLDVVDVRRRARRLATHVDQVVLEGALHDVVLSRRPVRERAHREMTSWARQVLGSNLAD